MTIEAFRNDLLPEFWWCQLFGSPKIGIILCSIHGSLRGKTHLPSPGPISHCCCSRRCHINVSWRLWYRWRLFNHPACLKYCSNICTCIRVCKVTNQLPWDKTLCNKPSLYWNHWSLVLIHQLMSRHWQQNFIRNTLFNLTINSSNEDNKYTAWFFKLV